MRFLLFVFVSTSLSFGQTYEVKDQHGIPVVTIGKVKLFRHSDYFKEDIPDFEAVVTNTSGQDLHTVPLIVTIHLKDGTTTDFQIRAAGICSVCDLRMDATSKATHTFSKPWAYTPETFESIEFSLPNSFLSPEDKRLLNEAEQKAAEEQAKKDAAEAVRRKRLAAEQKKKDAELDARLAKEKAEERRRVRAACSGIYENTVDKTVSSLTVGEEQQVRACQALGLYPPR